MGIGGIGLALGVLEYLTGRGGDAFFLGPFEGAVAFFRPYPGLFGPLSGVAPDFLHALGFSLISMAVAPGGRRWRTGICLGWLAVEAAFEVGQRYGSVVADRLPAWLGSVPVLGRLEDYFLRGTFDPADLAAVACGCASAWAIGEIIRPRFRSPA
jgi:hypothetical protein